MYGQGNYAPPQFGQGLQRPMPPYQQAPTGHPPPLQFQPGQPFQMQQCGPPHGGPPRGPGYPHVPPAPLNMLPHGPSNPSQSFLQLPMVLGAPPPRFHYPDVQPPQLPSLGPPRALPPPPLQRPDAQLGVYNVSLSPPPVSETPNGFCPRPNFTQFPPQLSVESQMILPPQLPPLPASSLPMVPNPPSSTLSGGSAVTDRDVPGQSQILESGSTVMVKIGGGGESTLVSHTDLSLKDSAGMELPPPLPKPADEAVLRNIEVLCQFIAKNGFQFEEMTRKKESGNPKYSFLVGGEPGSAASCAREYYLWMKKKCGILDLDNGQEQQNLSQMHADGNTSAVLSSSAIMATVRSHTDSDVDMEDDITQTYKKPEVYTSVDDLKSEAVSTEEVPIVQKQETLLLDAGDSSSPLNSNPPINLVLEAFDDITKADKESELYTLGEDLKSEVVSTGEVSDMQKHETAALTSDLPVKSEEEAEIKPTKSCGELGENDSPFRRIRDYASDDNSVDELPTEHGDPETVSPPPIFVTPGADSLLMNEETLAGQSETQGTLTIGCSSVKHESGDRYDTDDLSNSNTVFQGGYPTKSSAVETAASKDIDRKDRKSSSTAVKVDEFGRLVKEGASDSESDGTQHIRRRGKRYRSRSRSQSPTDSRRRRSPFRRKSRRSRSRSWSPKKRRSRSRSPNRSRGNFGGEYLRRGKAQTQDCFDFLKGRCYRGASCKYLHGDVGKSESSRRYKDKQYQADMVSARNLRFGDRVTLCLPLDYDDTKVEKMPYDPDKFDGDYLTTKTNDEKYEAESIDLVSNVLREDVQNPTVAYKNIESHREDAAHVQGASGEHMSHLLIGGEQLIVGMPSTGKTIHCCSDEAPQEDSCYLPSVVGSGNTGSSLVETSVISPSGISTESSQGLASNEPIGPCDSILNPLSPISNSPMPPLGSQTVNAPQQSSGLVEYSSITPVSFPHLHFVPPYHAPLSIQQSHYPVPTTSGSISQLQASIPLRPDFQNQMPLRDRSVNMAGYSQVSGLQYQAYHLPPSNVSAMPFVDASLARGDRFSKFSAYGHGSAGTYTPGVPTQPGHFPGESNDTQSFPGSNMHAGDPSKEALHSHQFRHQRSHAFGPSLTDGDSGPSHIGRSQSVSVQTSDPLVREHPSHLVDVGQSRISAHCNPYASTFDQPLSSRFSSAFAQERVSTASVKYDSSFSLNRGPIEGLAANGYGSGQIISSPNSSRPGGRMARLGGDQYDPLFDSIEPLSKHALNQDHAADNSDMLKEVVQQRALDVAENSKQKEVGAVLVTTSLDNDEYGETGDAEVGAVENGSLSDSDDDAIVAEGEIEIDQVNLGVDKKKSKDSRSMKLFKVTVANFVKEVLKPQWRQGNMSKEVFKTIVKKTVDKVSGAMKNHRIPKSQAKIDHYIDSSRRKLTQLVEGYVSKYKS